MQWSRAASLESQNPSLHSFKDLALLSEFMGSKVSKKSKTTAINTATSHEVNGHNSKLSPKVVHSCFLQLRSNLVKFLVLFYHPACDSPSAASSTCCCPTPEQSVKHATAVLASLRWLLLSFRIDFDVLLLKLDRFGTQSTC